jgi:phage/plasmid-associated DNA primase
MPATNSREAWELLKSMASGGDIFVEEKFKPAYTTPNTAKIIMTCNVLPYGTDPSGGFFRRLLIIPFENFVDEPSMEVGLAERILLTEKSGILNLIIKRIPFLIANNFKIKQSSEIVDIIKEDYKEDKDAVYSFAINCFNEYHDEDYQTVKKTFSSEVVEWQDVDGKLVPIMKKRTMYKFYEAWCKDCGIKNIMPFKSFGNRFTRVAYNVGIKDKVIKKNGSAIRYWAHAFPKQEYFKLLKSIDFSM